MASVTLQKMKSIDAIVDQLVSTGVYGRSSASTIKSQCKQVVQNLLHLAPTQGTYTTNTGETLTLLKLEGVIPTEYQGVTYQTPVVLWVPKGYPDTAPVAYVTPTKDMMVEAGHPHIDTSGLVFMPYLQSWNGACSLTMLIMEMCQVFSAHPPLRARPQGVPSFAPAGSAAGGSYNPFSAPSPAPAPGAGGGISYHSSPPAPALGRQRSMESAADKARFVASVTEKLRAEMGAVLEGTRAEVDKESDLRAGLERSAAQLDAAQSALQAHAAELLAYGTGMKEHEAALAAWCAAHEGRSLSPASAAAGAAPTDALSKQLLATVAEAAALEDAYSALTAALAGGAISLDEFVRETRRRAKRQFELKALAAKIHAAQGAAYARPAPRAAPPQYVPAPAPAPAHPAPLVFTTGGAWPAGSLPGGGGSMYPAAR